MNYYQVYILRLSTGNYYTGMTEDLFRRFLQHASGRSKSTRYGLPVILVAVYRVQGRIDARSLEKRIKNRGAYRFICSYGITA
jgi:putative endonuclease